MDPVPLDSRLSLAGKYSSEYLIGNRILPLDITDGRLEVAADGSPDLEVIDELELTFGCPADLRQVEGRVLDEAIRRAFDAAETTVELIREYGDGEAASGSDWSDLAADARDLANQPPVIRYVNLLIREAHQAGASDVHLEATRAGMRVRLRVDGVLSDVPAPPPNLQPAVVSRVKLLAELDIAERRLPQDGRIRVRLEDRELDLRVSTVPTLLGESLVMRLLARGGRAAALEDLGMMAETLTRFRAIAQRPHGMVLVAGPTGSGKTTTLYGALGLRDPSQEKIITIEDPVEYELPGINQVPVNAKAGVTFASALRSILRQDPNVILVGEMRDAETAAIAVQAAMTGHLVLTTLHTHDTTSAIPRLVDLQVEAYLVAATVEGILAQRLVRRVCPDCRERYTPDPELIALVTHRPSGRMRLERGRGCTGCRGTGYRGRTGLFELLTLTDDLKHDIAREPMNPRRRAALTDAGLVTLRHDGWIKVQAGITTVEEVLRVTEA